MKQISILAAIVLSGVCAATLAAEWSQILSPFRVQNMPSPLFKSLRNCRQPQIRSCLDLLVKLFLTVSMQSQPFPP